MAQLQHPVCRPKKTRRLANTPRWRHRLRTLILVLLLIWIMLAVQAGSITPSQTLPVILNGIVSSHRFNLAAWEVQALTAKTIARVHFAGVASADVNRSQRVQEYLNYVAEFNDMNDQIAKAYAALPAHAPASDEIRRLEARANEIRHYLTRHQLEIEHYMEQQVSSILQRQGITTVGIVFPPVLFHFSPLPLFLIVSPRERIEMQKTVDLQAGLSISRREEIERETEKRLNKSALVEEIGGYGAYPPMILEDPSLNWLMSTIAHEWVHNYLEFRPLGMAYDASPAMRTINETVASIIGDEIGARVIEAYYPWVSPPKLSWEQPRPPEVHEGKEETEDIFDFGRFMRQTRLEVERLLAAGDIAGAEQYMESRRQELMTHGIYLRKLNQAYFAFHGLYATGPSAIDPIGPKLEELRRRSGSLAEFLRIVEQFRQPSDLDLALTGR